MFHRYTLRKIAADAEGQLAEREAREKLAKFLPVVEAPEAIWGTIEARLARPDRAARRTDLRWAWAAVCVAFLVAAIWWVARRHGREWIETDARSRVLVKVGAIGTVEVEPNTRVRVVTDRASEHRFALAHGEIRASISAPPKLFFVDTASGTAVDLGCEYSLSTDEDGTGVLRVTKGWVSFEWHGLESLVPAGASCRTRAHAGPGIPYFDDAPEGLKQAADRLDLDVALKDARVRDTLTLWHLLSRVSAADRARVYDRIAALTPVPPEISRDLVLRLDRDTLTRLKDELAWTW
jgi:ferric-dicitrate binding protein FerR (iron transport regulator)